MDNRDELLYVGLGPIAAVALGVALIPFREFTTASNLSFAFVILTIAVAEFGGGWPALATAFVSALSLDFFLTQPYLRITIAGKHDIIAFVGLSLCGLAAAGLAAQRGRTMADVREMRAHVERLRSGLREMQGSVVPEATLTSMLETWRSAFPVAALVLRDSAGQVVASSQRAHVVPAPTAILDHDTLLPMGSGEGQYVYFGQGGIPLPKEGARIPLSARNRQVGWLDLWGSGARATAESRRRLSDMARLMAVMLAQGDRR